MKDARGLYPSEAPSQVFELIITECRKSQIIYFFFNQRSDLVLNMSDAGEHQLIGVAVILRRSARKIRKTSRKTLLSLSHLSRAFLSKKLRWARGPTFATSRAYFPKKLNFFHRIIR